MALKIDYVELHARLLNADKHLELVNYIFRIQGGGSRYLDYRLAAEALNLDRKTIRNYCNDLTDKGIIVKRFNGKNWELRLSDAILKEII